MNTIRLFNRHVNGHPDDLDAVTAFREYLTAQKVKYPVERVLEAVAAAHGLTVADLRTTSRRRAVSLARHHAAWELKRRRVDLSYQAIADALQRTNHATALHSVQTFVEYVKRGYYAAERDAVAKTLEDKA